MSVPGTGRIVRILGVVALAGVLIVALSLRSREDPDPRASDRAASPPASSSVPESAAPPTPTPTKKRMFPFPGRWEPLRGPTEPDSLTAEQREAIDRLNSIGYVSGSRPPRSDEIVTVLDEAAAFPGYNLFTSGHAPTAFLVDMHGGVLHKWSRDLFSVWPDYDVDPADNSVDYWRRAHLFPNGDLLVIFEGLGILKLDRDSRVLWANRVRAHHDVAVDPNGDLYVLTRKAHLVPRIHETEPILEDFITVLSADGEIRREISVLECLESSPYASLLKESPIRSGDLFHTNTVELLDGTGSDRAEWLRAGNLLISILKLNAVAVIDPARKTVVRTWTGEFRQQHDPKVLPDGRILLFDNGGDTGPSRVLELDPVTFEPTWSYAGTAAYPLFSRTCGTAQRLPNGNTLITESDNGRALEVTRDGRVVWEFYNPHRVGRDRALIATLFEMIRLPADFPIDWTSAARGG